VNFHTIVSSIVICLAFFGDLSAQTTIKSTAAKQTIAQYDKSVKGLNDLYRKARTKLVEKHQAESTKLKKNLIENLEITKNEETKAGNRDEAVAIGKQIQRLQLEANRPPDVSEKVLELELLVNKLKGELKELKSKPEDSPKVAISKEAIEFNNHHYLVVSDRQKRISAMIRCQLMGGHVVRIDSLQEHNFVRSLVEKHSNRAFWIDGNDLQKDGDWRYGNGEKMPYLDWSLGEPNGGGRANYLEMRSDAARNMSDTRREETKYYICEWDR